MALPQIKSNESNSAAFLKSIPLFSKLSTQVSEPIINSAAFKQFKKGDVLYNEDDKANYFYVVKSGWVKLFHQTMDGEEAVMDVLTCGHSFGDNSIYNDDMHDCIAEVVEDADIYLIPIDILSKQIRTNPEVAIAMLSVGARYRKHQEMEREHLSMQSAPQRIGCFLLRLCPLDKEEDIVINLPYDKVLLASRLGMKPETFSRALNALRKDTGIRVAGPRVEIDNIEQLTDFSCSACSSSHPCQDLT